MSRIGIARENRDRIANTRIRVQRDNIAMEGGVDLFSGTRQKFSRALALVVHITDT